MRSILGDTSFQTGRIFSPQTLLQACNASRDLHTSLVLLIDAINGKKIGKKSDHLNVLVNSIQLIKGGQTDVLT